MQAVYDNSARPGILMQFARRRDYMMRSEKRGGYNQGGSSAPRNGGKRPRRRKAGFFYIFFTLLLSVLIWPIGMIMLWRRKVRWRITTKLLTSIITLFLCVTLVGFGLTVQTDNPTVTKVQDSVNDFLDHSVEYTADAYSYICEKGVQVYESAVDIGDGLNRVYMLTMADALDAGVEYAAQARDFVVEKIAAMKAGDETAEPEAEITEAPETPAETDEAAVAEPTVEVTEAPVITEVPAATEAATDAPAITAPAVAADGELPVGMPAVTPDIETAKPIGEGVMDRDREIAAAASTEAPVATEAPAATEASAAAVSAEATDAPADEASAEAPAATEAAQDAPAAAAVTASEVPAATEVVTASPAPTASPEPTVAVIDPDLMPKPAGEAVVYYNSNGVNYHMASSCKNMKTASAGTLADAVEKGLRKCRNCLTPDASILDEENVVWVDEAGSFHLYDDCAEFEGKWSLMNLSDALAAGNLPCAACQSGLYMAACGEAVPTPTPEPTPTPSPTPEPTPTPAPVTVTPSYVLKPVGEAMVYHSSNGGWYHTEPDCSGMSGASLYPLSECAQTHKRCRKCEAPLPELLDEHCLWQDDKGACHTTDECPAFSGKYTLVIRDEALAAGMTGCTVCGSTEYLQPNTIIAYP